MVAWSALTGMPPTDAGRKNMLLLIQLRWIAIAGQLVTIAATNWLMGIELPLAPLLIVPALLTALNLLSTRFLKKRTSVSNLELTIALLIDVAALCWQLNHSGGLTNPFVSLFLLQVVIGAILLEQRSSWSVVIATLIAMATLTLEPEPLVLPSRYADDPMALYLLGSLICFVMVAVLLVAVVTRVSRNLRDADAALAMIRQRAAEEDHIVRMGLLASGAAHELGTPMSSMAVILGDLARHPAVTRADDLLTDVSDMQAELQRCKLIVSGILTSAGEARGENPSVTTVRAFVADIVADWRGRTGGDIRLVDNLGEDVMIVSDPALRQVIGNVIDNAREVSRTGITIVAAQSPEALVLEVLDNGPGFTPAMLEAFGRPYSSTKGKTGGGLGLFLVVNVIRKLGGRVEVANREEGGAMVRMTIPLGALAYSERPER